MQLYPKQRKLETTNEYGVKCIKYLQPTKLDRLYFKFIFWPIVSPVLHYFNTKRVIDAKAIKDIIDVEIDGINFKDHPDYCDAFISGALWRNSLTQLTEAQLDQLNDKHSDFVYESVINHIY
jgi:hypothetical protein